MATYFKLPLYNNKQKPPPECQTDGVLKSTHDLVAARLELRRMQVIKADLGVRLYYMMPNQLLAILLLHHHGLCNF